MPRPSLPVRAARRRLLAGGALALAAGLARAQSSRPIPEGAEVGVLRIGVFPEAALDGKPVLLAPGLRIHDERNMIVPPASVTGDRPIAYRRGASGEILQAWLLSAAEHRELAAKIAAARRAGAAR
ncbi:MAG TPA: hypothetical protein VEA81_02835 [Burkholderiaceae bacterium]|nr:hypothetical protein [Burkholderiaceae bacterium]